MSVARFVAHSEGVALGSRYWLPSPPRHLLPPNSRPVAVPATGALCQVERRVPAARQHGDVAGSELVERAVPVLLRGQRGPFLGRQQVVAGDPGRLAAARQCVPDDPVVGA